jgi:hypothetical protein
MLFHTVFNRTVENFHRPFIIRASSSRMYGSTIALKQTASSLTSVPPTLWTFPPLVSQTPQHLSFAGRLQWHRHSCLCAVIHGKATTTPQGINRINRIDRI